MRDLRRYAAQLPPDIHCVLQAQPEVTVPRFTHSNISDISRGRGGQVYVLVHNEAEGCARLTVLALARMLVEPLFGERR